MKTSRYNIFVDSPESRETIIFNSLYGSLSIWDQDEIAIVKNILSHPKHSEDKNSKIKSVLQKQNNLIDDSIDEISIIENRKRSGISDANRLDIIVMPTLDCNLACPYCYEAHHASKLTDAAETAIKLWIGEQFPKYKVVMFHWFGGEPLLDYHRVLSITQHATAVSSSSGTSLIMHMTTNGYLLTTERIQGLINAGLYDFQITLDGPPEVHNRFRPSRNGEGTFDRIFQNIIALARADELVKISLRINFNHNNLEHIPLLLELFPIDVRAHLRVVYEPIFGNCSLSATDNLSPETISLAMSNHYTLARQLGYDVVLGTGSLNTGRLVYCYAERENQYIISYNGNVFKCSVSEFKPEERIGYLHPDGLFIKEDVQWSRWMDVDLFEDKCYSCIYLPLCMGGCRKTRLHNSSTGSYCSLVSTNSSYLLKQVAFGRFKEMMRENLNGELSKLP